MSFAGVLLTMKYQYHTEDLNVYFDLSGIATVLLGLGSQLLLIIADNETKKNVSSKIKDEYDFTLDKFMERGRQYVGIRNHINKTIKSCVIFSNDIPCVWSQSKTPLPRHLAGGEADNVLIPENHEKINPTIIVMSGNEIFEKVKLDKIVIRP